MKVPLQTLTLFYSCDTTHLFILPNRYALQYECNQHYLAKLEKNLKHFIRYDPAMSELIPRE